MKIMKWWLNRCWKYDKKCMRRDVNGVISMDPESEWIWWLPECIESFDGSIGWDRIQKIKYTCVNEAHEFKNCLFLTNFLLSSTHLQLWDWKSRKIKVTIERKIENECYESLSEINFITRNAHCDILEEMVVKSLLKYDKKCIKIKEKTCKWS